MLSSFKSKSIQNIWLLDIDIEHINNKDQKNSVSNYQ